MFNQGFLRCF